MEPGTIPRTDPDPGCEATSGRPNPLGRVRRLDLWTRLQISNLVQFSKFVLLVNSITHAKSNGEQVVDRLSSQKWPAPHCAKIICNVEKR